MTAPRPIETNFSDSQGQQVTNATRSPVGPYDLMQYGATLGGPFAVEMAAHQTGGYNNRSASIVSAAVNASAGGGLGTYSGASVTPYNMQAGYGYNSMPQTQAVMRSGGGATRQVSRDLPAPIPPGGSPIDIASAQVQSADMDFAAFFTLQQVASQQTLKWTGLSNVVNQRDSALANILRNVKV